MRVAFGERTLALVCERALGERDLVDAIRQEARGEFQPRAVGLHREIIDGGRDPQRFTRAKNVEHFGRRRETQRQTALRRGLIGRLFVVRAGVAVGSLRSALQHVVALRAAPAATAIGVADGKGRRRARAQFEDRIVETGFVRKFQPQHGDAAVGDRRAEAHDVGLLVLALGALERANVEITRAQRLRTLGRNARRLAQFDGDEPRERRHIDGLCEGQRDLVEIRHGIGVFGRRCRFGRGQKRDEFRARILRLHLDALQRLPRFGRAELQRARADPPPFARRLRRDRHEAFGLVLGAAGGRAGIGVEEDGDRIPGAQETVRHDARAIGAHEFLGRKFRRGDGRLRLCRRGLPVGLGEGGRRQRREASRGEKEREDGAFHGLVSQRGWVVLALDLRPARPRNFSISSGGGPAGGGSRPTSAGRTTAAEASAGMRASSM